VLRILGAHIPTCKLKDGSVKVGLGFYPDHRTLGAAIQHISTRNLPTGEWDSPTGVKLRENQLPQYAPQAHYAVLRLFRADQAVRFRFQLIGFSFANLWMQKDKHSGMTLPQINRSTMRVLASFGERGPKFSLFNKRNDRPDIVGGNLDQVKKIIEALGLYGGVDLAWALSVSAKLRDTTGKTVVEAEEEMDMSVEPLIETISSARDVEDAGPTNHAAAHEEEMDMSVEPLIETITESALEHDAEDAGPVNHEAVQEEEEEALIA
jgi:hypothetical protein